jgi:uncharacterized protein (DUF2147 family)
MAMARFWLNATIGCAVLLVCGSAAASDPASPAGSWRTIDDQSGLPRAVVKIVEVNGVLSGVVEQSLGPDTGRPNCDDCTGDRRGKAIIGLDILRDIRKDGAVWGGGTILDPESGDVYRCTLELRNGGQQLAVRGFIGISLFGRTQVWERLD